MRLTRMLLPTLREVPNDAEIDSHILMIRSGMMRKLGSGLYTFLPLGFKALQNVVQIVREEMDRSGAQELLPPVLVPAEVWKESGRYQVMGKEQMRLKDRHDNEHVLCGTHEEVFTSVVRENVHSYRQLPITLYQINTKYRDEIRPRFGVMRCREFIMKDAYSFHANEEDLNKAYEDMRLTYRRIFKRCGLDVSPVLADNGAMGGSISEEFMVPSTIGEAEIIKCPKCDYVANVERAVAKSSFVKSPEAQKKMEEVSTPNTGTIDELVAFFKTTPDKFIKSIIYVADGKPVMAVIRGDLIINETKLRNKLGCVELDLANETTILKVTGAPVGFASPVGLKDLRVIADESVTVMANAITGANKKDTHLSNVNPGRDFALAEVADIRNVVTGDACTVCGSRLESYRGIEVGQIFKLGYKYTESMDVKVLDKDGKALRPIMGTYGIGVGRTLASVIEQSHDANGIVWPMSIAPYQVIVTPVNMQDEEQVKAAENLYHELSKHYQVLLDDRDERPGVKFKDADLIGIPVRVTVGKSLKETQQVEVKERQKADKELVALADTVKKIGEIYEKQMAPFRI
jgi:prolyl-tRNA synthetase